MCVLIDLELTICRVLALSFSLSSDKTKQKNRNITKLLLLRTHELLREVKELFKILEKNLIPSRNDNPKHFF